MATKKDTTNIVTIDFNVWCTQQQRANYEPRKLNTLSQQVKRLLDGKSSPLKINDVWHIEPLGITLVRRID